MTHEEYERMEEYFEIVRYCVAGESKDELDIEVMEYIKNVLAKIEPTEIEEISKCGIAEMRLTAVDKDGESVYDYVTLANDGESLAILQGIGRIKDEKRGKDKLKIGIILDKAARIKRFDVIRDGRGKLEKIEGYREILEVAEYIERREQKKDNNIRGLLLSIISFFEQEPKENLETLDSEQLARIIVELKKIAGDEAFEIYTKRRNRENGGTTIEQRINANRSVSLRRLTPEELEEMYRRAAEERRKQIKMTMNPNKSNKPNNLDNDQEK